MTEENIRMAFAIYTEGYVTPSLLQCDMTEAELAKVIAHVEANAGWSRTARPREAPVGLGMNRGYALGVNSEDRKAIEESFADWVNNLADSD